MKNVNYAIKGLMLLTPGVNVMKLFTAVSYAFSKKARAFVPGKPFQPSPMFVSEARSLPRSGACEMCFTGVGSGLTCKH